MVNPTSHLQGVDFIDTWRRNIGDLVFGNGEGDVPDAADVQDTFNDQRSAVRKAARDLGFDGEYRPKVVNNTDEFDTPSLAQLRAKVDAINLTTVVDLVTAWKEISTRNSTSLDTFRKQIARGMAPDVWTGTAATAAAQTVAGYDITGKKVTTAAALTSSKLDELRTGLEPTKNLVPYPPEHRSGGANLRSWLTGRGWRDDDVAQQNAKAEAVRVLRTVYAPVVHESDTDVPLIPIPKAIENDGGSPEIPGGGTQPGNQGGITQPTTQQQATTPTTTPASATPTTDPDDPDTSTEDSTTPESTTPQSTEPGSTTPASTTPSSTLPGSGSPAGLPSGAGSPGGGSPGAGSPGAGSPGAGTPGGAVPGSPAAGSTAGRGAGVGAGAAGRSGTPGMMGPGAGKGGGKDDESTKGIPDYLITQEHGDELTGLGNLPRTVPPVIGAD
ncbi:hypothetical protein ACFWUP_09750 [Nocardia sp. NPDC058658]|uniref:hypothetical protein n=1 Tax=Nocardia sp. NPDC058658 TaxID=3346580 RepID=UPI0036689E51